MWNHYVKPIMDNQKLLKFEYFQIQRNYFQIITGIIIVFLLFTFPVVSVVSEYSICVRTLLCSADVKIRETHQELFN